MPEIQGIGHVALTVTDLARSAEWYERVLGATKLRENWELLPGHTITIFAAGPLILGLHRDDKVDSGDRFDEHRIGMDHLSFLVSNRAEVEAWAKRLDERGVEHSAIADEHYGHVVVFRDPDNIQLEFMALPDEARDAAPSDAPATRGVSHLAISVGDIERSAEWYRKVFSDPPSVASMREEEFAIEYLMPNDQTVLGLQWSKSTSAGDRFDEFRVGLDHVGFSAANRAEVDAWLAHFDELGVEHSGITEAPYGHVLVFRDPDNVQLELLAPPG